LNCTSDYRLLWDYFDVVPERAQVIWEGGQRQTLDGVTHADKQWAQGEALARESLRLARRYREADCCEMRLILDRAYEIVDSSDHPAHWAAYGFIEAVLNAAIEGAE
jgi:hypothetical protein